jgi:hypothetical protein
MKIAINDRRKVFAIQEAFSKAFPYLKLEFLVKPHQVNGGHPGKFIKHNSITVGECRSLHKTGNLTITENMTVANLERRFADIYGLGVQVFRKSGKMWLETSVTGDWTLAEQNRQGEHLSGYFTGSTVKPDKDHAGS